MSRTGAGFSRRGFLRSTSASVLTAAALPALGPVAQAAPGRAAAGGAATERAAAGTDPHAGFDAEESAALAELDQLVEALMAAAKIPGVALGMYWHGKEYLRGYGVANLDYPVPVDPDTVFRIASTTKTFTGTVAMQLVERGRLDLDRPVRHYLPDFATADPSVAHRVTVRQLLNHSAGWLGDFLVDTGPGDDALARFAAALRRDPQLTPPGTVFHYNNAAIGVAGRVLERASGQGYEALVRSSLIDPLGLRHSRFSTDEIIGFNVAASHLLPADADPAGELPQPVVEPSAFTTWRSVNAFGGLISSARDQLRYARFHLGDGTAPSGAPGAGTRLLDAASLRAMSSRPGPGGTLFVELDGVGVTWMLRPTAEGVRVLQHGGSWPGQQSGFLIVPERDFALTVLTNSDTGSVLTGQLFAGDWALRRFAGVGNLPASLRALPAAELAPYAGDYLSRAVGPDGVLQQETVQVVAVDGQLEVRSQGVPQFRLGFYREDGVLLLAPDGVTELGYRSDFVRGPKGEVAWLRYGGRLLRRLGPPSAPASALRAAPRGARGRVTVPFRTAPLSAW